MDHNTKKENTNIWYFDSLSEVRIEDRHSFDFNRGGGGGGRVKKASVKMCTLSIYSKQMENA